MKPRNEETFDDIVRTVPKRRRKKPEPQETNFLNATADAVPGYSITNLSEQDVLELHEGRVPAWLQAVTASWLAWTKSPSAGLQHDREAKA